MDPTVRDAISPGMLRGDFYSQRCTAPGSRVRPRITASGRCAPPDNKPTLEELNNCQPYLEQELKILNPKVIVCLGRIAFERILKIYSIRNSIYKFGHGASYKIAFGCCVPIIPASKIPPQES
jgi:uracil-DNA glycosylase family 4